MGSRMGGVAPPFPLALLKGADTVVILFILILAAAAGAAHEWDFQTSQTYISTMLEDDEGIIWCATSGGLIRYHPLSGWLEPMVYPRSLPWTGAADIHLQDSLIWIATTGGGLALGNGDSWQVFSSYEGVPGSGNVYAVHSAGGYVWAGTDGGLARGDEGGFITVDSELTGGAFTAGAVTGISSDGNTLYLATDRGVYSLDLAGSIFDPAAWTSYTGSTISLGIQDIYIHGPDSVFGFGGGGVALKTDSTWTRLLDYSFSSDSVITGLLVTEDGLLASGRVVLLYDGGNWVRFGNDYPDESYGSCLNVIQGRLWCGYGLRDANARNTGRGLGYLEEGSWKTLAVPGMGGASCYQMARDGDRTYLGSHRVGLMAHYPEEGWALFNNLTADMPRSLRTYSAAVTDAPGVWTSSYGWGLTWIGDRGTFTMEDDTVITFVADSLPGVSPEVVQVDSPMFNNQVVMLASQEGALWVAQEAYWATPGQPSGIVAVAGNPEGELQWATRTEADGLARKNVLSVFPVGEDSLWIAFTSDGGCQLLVHGGDPVDRSSDTWYPGPGEAYSTAWGLPSNQVFSFTRNSEGSILLGTGNGLCRWNGTAFNETGGVSGSVEALEADGSGTVWCMTEDAIYAVGEAGTTVYNSSNSIYLPAGRSESEFSYRDPVTGTVYFSSLRGLWSISPEQVNHQGPAPLFYPQPYLPAEQQLRMAWSGDRGPVTVKFYSLAGEYLGLSTASSWENWSWNGSIDGNELASGVYIVLVETGSGSAAHRIALVR